MIDQISITSNNLRQFISQHSTFLYRVLVVMGVLVLSALLAFKTSPSQSIQILIMIGGAGVGLFFLRWPSLGLIIASVAGLLVQTTGPGGINVTVVLVTSLLGLWLVNSVVLERKILLVPSKTNLPLVAFIVVSILSFGVGQLPWFTLVDAAPLDAQLGGFSIYVLSFLGLLLVANQIRELRKLEWMTWLFIVVSAVYTIGLLIPDLRHATNSFFPQMSTLFWIWLVALAFSQAVHNDELKLRWRLASCCLVVASLYILFILKYNEKSGWIPAFIVVAVILAFRSWKMALVMSLVGLLVAVGFAPQVLGSEEYSVTTRLEATWIMLEIVKKSPVLGLGFANYYWYTPLFPILGWAVQFNSHNNYLDILAQTGIVGMVCFLWFIWNLTRVGWGLRKRVEGGFARAYLYGSLGGLLGTLVAGIFGDWMLPFVYNVGLKGFRTSVLGWLFLGGIVVLEQLFPPSEEKVGYIE